MGKDKDFHGECPHCIEIKAPIWPVEDLDKWKLDLCHCLAQTEEGDRVEKQAKLDQVKSAEKDAKRKKDIEQKRRDQKADRMRTIRERRGLGLLQINYGGNTIMAKKNSTETKEVKEKVLTKTGYLDQLIAANLEGSYGEGAKETIVTQVLERFPDLDAKRVSGLFFSRRAVLKAQAAKLSETATA